MIARINIVLFSLILWTAGIAQAADVECYSRGVAHTILNDGSGVFPVVEAGEVFVSLTDDATPVWTEGSYTSEVATNYGAATTGKVKQNFYYWARAKQGYNFVGWNTSKTGKTPASGSETEGAPYLKAYTHWSAGTASAPKEQVMYAIFEKIVSQDSEPADLGDGAPCTAVEDNEYYVGSSTRNYAVRILFSKGLQFIDKAKASEGYGVNSQLLPYVTCKGADQAQVSISRVLINAAYRDDTYTVFQPAYGVVELPNTLAVGTYTVHLPYGLFNTQDGGVTASCDFQVVVREDDTKLVLLSHLPAEGSAWDADPESEDLDGESVLVTLTFNKTLTQVNTDKAIRLTSATGRIFSQESCYIGKLNTSQGLVSFGTLPNGTYTFSMPADVFVGANGLGNEPVSFTFSVKGSKADEWVLPTYTNMTSSPSNNSVVRSLTQISINLSRPGYDSPIGLLSSKGKVTASKVSFVYPEDADPNDPEVLPTMVSENIEGVTAAVKNGVLLINFATPFAEEGKVMVHVPAGIVNNLAMPVATMTPEEICNEGGCTNQAFTLSYDVHPVSIKVKDVTGIGVVDHWEKDDQGHDVRVDTYRSLIDAQLVPPVNNGDDGDRVTYIYFWYPEEFASLNYTGGASITNITTQKPYEIVAVEFKTGGDAYRKNVIQMRLSTENFIYSDLYDQGVYEVVLPDSIARTADGMLNEGITFRFTYGDPDKAYHPESVSLDDYLGTYCNVSDEGEVVAMPETFRLEKKEDRYYVTELCGSSLVIPVEANNSGFVLKFTENKEGDAFMSYNGGDVFVNFVQQEGKAYIFIDQYALYFADGRQIVGGVMYYEQYTSSGIETLSYSTGASAVYNLSGQRCRSSKGFILRKGVKVMIK